jgi:hypothetical protein
MTIRYCPYFCEENVWHLCTDERVIQDRGPVPVEERRVVFISNARRQVAMRNQRAGGREPVLWDYHVVLLAGGKVWDPDTTLGFPVDIDPWVGGSFYPLHPDFAPRFRVIDGPTYLSSFASDRSHMLGPDGVPLKPLPPWPRIGVGMNLPRFVDMETPFVGELVDLESFRRKETRP